MSDEIQNVAACITTADGIPVDTVVALTGEHGDTLQRLHTTPSGWVMVSFLPERSGKYFLMVGSKENKHLYALPETDDTHPALRIVGGKKQLGYYVNGQLPKGCKLYAYHQKTGLMLLPLKKSGIVDLQGTGTGLVSLLLTDSHDATISESHYWHQGVSDQTKEQVPLADCMRKDTGMVELAANEALALPAEEGATTFVRFLSCDEAKRQPTCDYIPSAEAMVNFGGDLASQEPFPTFSSPAATNHTTDVMCWLCSARFMRMDVAKTMKDGWQARFQPEVAHLIRGSVSGMGKHWKLREGIVVAYQRSNSATFSAEINSDGTFTLPVGDYPVGDDFFIEAFDKKNKAAFYEYDFLGDTIPSLRNHLHLTLPDENAMGSRTPSTDRAFSFTGTNMIPEVVARASVRKDYDQENKEFYGNRYISEEVMESRNYQTFQQMIYHFAPYMRLVMEDQEDQEKDPEKKASRSVAEAKRPPEYHLFPAMRISTLGGKEEIKIFVDGVLLTATEAINLNMQSVATVEFMSPAKALARHTACLNGCLEIITKDYKPELIKSKGVLFAPPLGIANIERVFEPVPAKAPAQAGDYLMLIDRISPKGIESYRGMVVVK